jgi:ribonuclease D
MAYRDDIRIARSGNSSDLRRVSGFAALRQSVDRVYFTFVVETPGQLAALLSEISGLQVLAVDTEADSLHAYPEKVCLIQVSYRDHDVLIDPLSEVDLSPLFEVLRGQKLILHGADYDLRMLYRTYRFVPSVIFDTMLAARLLGFSQFGLNHLVQKELGVVLEKGPQKLNWARRPLTERMATYARNDTHYLAELADRLTAELKQAGRLEWQQQVCAKLISECTQPVEINPDEVWRIKGSDRLPRRALSVLRSLWKWREQEARAFNTPPFFILDHDSLIQLSSAASEDPRGDHTIRIKTTSRRKEGLKHALQEGLAVPLSESPEPRRAVRYYPSDDERRNYSRLKVVRDRKAEELKLDPSLIASKAMLVTLSQNYEEGLKHLMPWQREALTAEMGRA